MRQIELSYEELKQEFINELAKLGNEGLYQRGILATSEGDQVTARRMWLIPDGLTLYCHTDGTTRKCKQINANPNVAVVAGFLQIEGVASVRGHPLAKGNTDFIEAFKESQPEKYESYKSNYQNLERDLVLIKIEPKRIAMFKYTDPSSGIERGLHILNVAKEEAHRVVGIVKKDSDPKGAPAYSD